MTEVAIVHSACANMHVTSVLMLTPVLLPSGEVDGLLNSSATYCDVCGSSEMTTMDCELRHVDLPESERDTHAVRRA